ncbi:MBL fold metallo-hydrolase [Streptomyces sp. NBC_01387]|uniref:MBL fold metallo-hydrolase n=1 Tax=unclassified Streptomyces TaxID=2593676 RepID=UPI00202521E7|nr:MULTISPECIES: MBL fold metallo-hydrolase [unclassified Streptomyces]WSC18837.1 MBL fold metallo-hydrolase [Streptomyces sp. NBC_01766]WSV52873.1 MBL fold metallo-hydrolase [Streptomyces sp. NBC_01014]
MTEQTESSLAEPPSHQQRQPEPDVRRPDRGPSVAGPSAPGRSAPGRSTAGPSTPGPSVAGRSTAQASAPTRTRPPGVLRPPGEIRSWPKSFADRLTAPLPGVRAMARLAREGAARPRPEGLRDIPLLPYAPAPLPETDTTTVAVTWAGHASWVVRIGGLTVLTDPVWSRRILGTPARVTPVGVRWADLPRIDAVVISHNHYDHLDAPTLKRLPRDTPLFVPAGLGRWCRRRRFTRVTELDWWEAAETGGVRLDFVPAHHWSKRTLTDTCRSLWGGWVLSDQQGQRVYFAGDTGYGRWFKEIGRRHPGIDLALLPIGAYDPRWMLGPVHTDPEEAVAACEDLGARRMAPMHWGTFLLSAEPVLEPLTRVRAAWQLAGRPRDELWDLPVGGSRVL